jgi:G:T/U-mismatch repair DNA glycosylase
VGSIQHSAQLGQAITFQALTIASGVSFTLQVSRLTWFGQKMTIRSCIYGCGLTAAVERPTVRADELARHEFQAAALHLEKKVRRYRARYLAFLGKPAFAAIFRENAVRWGRQSVVFGGAMVWVLPNPSGLNRAFTLDALVSAYCELQLASSQADSA